MLLLLKVILWSVAAMDFFTVPTLTFRLLYVLFIIHHPRRKILYANVTAHPTAAWVRQQLSCVRHSPLRTDLGIY